MMAEDESTDEATMPQQPVTTTAPAAASPQPVAPSDAAAETAAAAFVEEVRQRVARANYGVSANVGITMLDRGDHSLVLFEANEHQEALRAASAALATTPDDDARGWRFVGSGPDLETGRYRAVVRVSSPPSPPPLAVGPQLTESVARVAPE